MTVQHGVWAASVTPFNTDLTVDVGALTAHVDWLLDNGCNGVALLASTGEANSIGINERLALIQAVEGNWQSDRVMVGVGTTAVPDTVGLIHTAIDHEFDNVLMLPPFYFTGITDDGLFQTMVEIVRRLGHEKPSIYLYDHPEMSGFALSAGLQARLKDAYPELVAGVTDASGNIDKMADIARRTPDYAVFSGTEELLLPLWLKGGTGCISATCNVTAPAAGRVWTAISDGDVAAAEKAQAALTAQRLALQNWPLVPALKSVLRHYFPGRISRMLRPPLLAMSDLDRDRLMQALEDVSLELN